MRTILICHAESELNREAVARWLQSFSDLAGIVLLSETKSRFFKRVRWELKRIGWLRLIDVLLMKLYYLFFVAREDRETIRRDLHAVYAKYSEVHATTAILEVESVNDPRVEEFLRARQPDAVIARCKQIMAERIFSIPRLGTFILHAGSCPEYRNSHGAFWALANNEPDKAVLTLLAIDKGIDTGPVYGQFSYSFDEAEESHMVIQTRLLLKNLDEIRSVLLAIESGDSCPIDTTGRASGVWGQPWLTRYLRWKRRAIRKSHESHRARIS